MSFVGFPPHIAEIIAWYLATYQISDWVKKIPINQKITTYQKYMHKHLSSNPMAMDVISDFCICWDQICENEADWAVDLILANKDKIDWYFLAHNPNPRAFALVKEYIESKSDQELIMDELDEMLSANPCAIEVLKERPSLINPIYLMWNPNAEQLIEEKKIPICYESLRCNSALWAVKLLLQKFSVTDTTSYYSICANPNSQLTEKILHIPDLIDWDGLSQNPTAIEHLRAHPDKVKVSIYSNPAIFELTVSIVLVDVLKTKNN